MTRNAIPKLDIMDADDNRLECLMETVLVVKLKQRPMSYFECIVMETMFLTELSSKSYNNNTEILTFCEEPEVNEEKKIILSIRQETSQAKYSFRLVWIIYWIRSIDCNNVQLLLVHYWTSSENNAIWMFV